MTAPASEPNVAPSYRILAVCTGNICRSPFMERLLVARLRQRLGDAAGRFAVSSAGTWAMVDNPMAEEAAATLVERGGDPTDFTGRELTADLVGAADLVITATREHRADVVRLEPRAAARTMTLREFARLLAPVAATDIDPVEPTERMAAVVAAARANRGLVPVELPDDDDIADPYRRRREAYALAADQIDAALTVILDRLAPST